MKQQRTGARSKPRGPSAESATRKKARAELEAGLHAATIELRSGDHWAIRTATGARMQAVLADDVQPAFAMDCLRTSRPVIVTQTERGPTVLGALQTSLGVTRDADDRVTIEGKEVRVRATERLRIEADDCAVLFDPEGRVRLEGDRMVIDVATLVRFLSGRVELP